MTERAQGARRLPPWNDAKGRLSSRRDRARPLGSYDPHTLFRHAMTAFHHVGASFHGAPTNISALAVEKIPRRRCRHGMTPRGGSPHAVTAPACFPKPTRFYGSVAAME